MLPDHFSHSCIPCTLELLQQVPTHAAHVACNSIMAIVYGDFKAKKIQHLILSFTKIGFLSKRIEEHTLSK